MRVEDIQAGLRYKNLERCVLPILAEGENGSGVHGSASLFTRGGCHFLVTATHVAEAMSMGYAERIGVPVRPSQRNVEVRTLGKGVLASSDREGVDVSVFRIDEGGVVSRLLAGNRTFLTDDDVDRANLTRVAGNCVVFGWPDSKATFDGEVVSGSPVAMLLSRVAPDAGALETDIFLEWPASSEEVPDLGGISGSPLWRVADVEPSGVWEASKELKLIGVQHRVLNGRFIRGTDWRVVDKLVGSLL